MSSEGSVTRLIGMLKDGDRVAAQRLWETYFRRLVGLARARLAGSLSPAADAEDVALSAFDSFCRRAERGNFPLLEDRDDLWQLLFVLTVRKAINLVRYQGRKSRGAGRVVSLADLEDLGAEIVLGTEPSPEFAAEMADECRRLLDLLPDATLRAVALWKMEGFTNREIAAKLGCVETTVERKLHAIRELWSGASDKVTR
jgi:DNA-directed RNA polymerase specialized sigma24 family protein